MVQSAYERVITAESRALDALAQKKPVDFDEIVARILASDGRLVVSGIGKSGHIGRKIAATLASTGTPSLFVHPSEASHGDLGVITRSDICLLISNSGEATELGDILAYTKRFSIPLIGLTRRPDSTLGQASDYLLLMPPVDEACPMGLAPTTSTVMTLALGDALGVALMEKRGFAAENFAVFHPGGKIGSQLQRVSDLMHRGSALPKVETASAMSETLIEMTSKGLGIAAVVDSENRLVGIVTDGDLRRKMDGLLDCTAGEVATRNPVTVVPETLAAEALSILNDNKISVLIVLDQDQHPVGVVHIHDLLRAGVA